MDQIIVVGGSAAGTSAARTLRRNGHTGSVILVTDEPHLPYRRPPLSKWHLTNDGGHDDIAIDIPAELSVDVRTSTRAVRLDTGAQRLVVDTGEAIPYDGLVIATGARVRELPALAGVPGVYSLRTIDDAVALRTAFRHRPKVAVVGGGFIGTEVAATARGLGLDVTLIETATGLYTTTLGAPIGSMVADLHREHGTRIVFGVPVRRCIGDARVRGLELADGSIVEADIVIVGIGTSPATQWLEGSGLTLDQGVVCDATCAAIGSDTITAAGDVARWHNPRYGRTMRVEHWDNAVAQGAAAAKRLLGDRTAFAPVPFFWTDQYDLKLQVAGMTGPDLDFEVIEGDLPSRQFVGVYRLSGVPVGVVAANSPGRFVSLRRSLTATDSIDVEDAVR